MGATATMPRRKSSDSSGGDAAPTGKFTKAVKLRDDFYTKLMRVAGRKKKYPGDLIESQMRQWVEGENLLALEEEAKESAAALAAAKAAVKNRLQNP